MLEINRFRCYFIAVLPEVLAPLPNETVAIEGQPATLQCRIEARPAPLIKWYKDGVLLTGPDYVVTSVTVPSGNGDTDIVTSTLNITSAKASDNGKIKCEAEIPTNTVGSETKIFVYCKYYFTTSWHISGASVIVWM